MPNKSCLIASLVVVVYSCLITLSSDAHGGIFTTHALARVSFQDPFSPGVFSLDDVDTVDTDTRYYSYPNLGQYEISGSARAFAKLDANHLLGGASAAYADIPGYPSAVATAESFWRDIAILDNDLRPDVIRLHFSIEGVLSASVNGVARLAVSSSHRVSSGFEYFGNIANIWVGSDFIDYEGFDSALAIGVDGVVFFTGTFYVDAYYDIELGGYDWGVALTAQSQAGTSFIPYPWLANSAEVLALNSIAIQRVTDLEGNLLSVTFDSGLELNSSNDVVPEPISLLVWSGFGALGLVAGAVRRRRNLRGGRVNHESLAA